MKINNIYVGDNIEVLKTFPDNSIDSVVTDPPYGLGKEPNAIEVLQSWVTVGYHEVKGKGFMGKVWDAFVPQPLFWKEIYRVLKPGGYVLSFAGTRTYDWMVMAVRLAGFEIRDMIAWVYGSGFPKSHDISKAIDKKGGNPLIVDEISGAIKKARLDRKLTFKYCDNKYCNGSTNWSWYEGRKGVARVPDVETFNKICEDFAELSIYKENIKELEREVIGTITRTKGIGIPAEGKKIDRSQYEHKITTSNSDNAKQWQGWGTALKPALEPIVMARKPLDGTVAQNVLKHGVGGINIDASRVPTEEILQASTSTGMKYGGNSFNESSTKNDPNWKQNEGGRFPANFIHDGSDEVERLFPETNPSSSGGISSGRNFGQNYEDNNKKQLPRTGYDDNGGSASRFFYVAKASQEERNFGLYDFEEKQTTDGNIRSNQETARTFGANSALRKNIHPTVKPIELMRYLVRMITPPNGICLDPYLGSGTTAIACKMEKFNYIGIELDEQYVEIAKARVEAVKDYETSLDTKTIIKESIKEDKEKEAGIMNIFDFMEQE